MLRRSVILLAVLGVFVVPGATSAAARTPASITGGDMARVTVGSACGLRMNATLVSVGRSMSVDFQIHSQTYGTTIHVWKGLSAGQTSVSATLTVCSAGDTWDRLTVVLHQGRSVLDTEVIVKTVVCAPQ